MEAQAKKTRNSKIQPLDWKEAAQSPALKGMMSFLDISPEDIRRGHYPDIPASLHIVSEPVDVASIAHMVNPVDSSSTADVTSAVVVLTPIDVTSIVDATTPVVDQSAVVVASPTDESFPGDNMYTEYGSSPMDGSSPVDGRSSIDATSPGRAAYTPAKRTLGMVVGEVPTLNRKILRCRLAQDGHTSAEESVYKTLWDVTTPADRTVRMGYAELAARTRLSRKTIGRLLQSLKAKLALETLDEHRSGDLVPKNYRVYSYKEILDRRREAGLEYVIRMNGVIFVTAAGIPIIPHEGKEREGYVPGPMDVASIGYDSSAADIKRVSEELNRFWAVDEAAAVQLIQSCRAIRPDATTDEIVFFIREKVHLIRTSRTIANPTGFILATVPQCFAGQTFESFRTRRAESLRLAAEETERKAEDDRKLKEYFRQQAEAVIANPDASEAKRKEAENTLRWAGK